MPLSAGDKLGPYEILAPLGAGGMGEVYRAQDTRLKREVALKILPQALAHDPVRRQRFEQEARAVAALNHPNIVAIYDIGSENGVLYIVTELVDGETLNATKLNLRRTLDCAVQIATGSSGRARRSDHASRLETRQHSVHPRRPHQDSGFRSCQDFGASG